MPVPCQTPCEMCGDEECDFDCKNCSGFLHMICEADWKNIPDLYGGEKK